MIKKFIDMGYKVYLYENWRYDEIDPKYIINTMYTSRYKLDFIDNDEEGAIYLSVM